MLTPAKLKEARKKLKLTQKVMAHQLGVCNTTYKSMEAGRTPFKRQTVLAILYLLEHPEKVTKPPKS